MVEAEIVEEQTRQFIEAGADLVSVHAENGEASLRAVALAKELGAEAGVVLRLETPVAEAEPFLAEVAFFTLLGTSIGVKGQNLSDKACDRLREARSLMKRAGREKEIVLAADGGIREQTVPLLRAAGAETVVLGSLAFGDTNLPERIAWLHALETRP
jgi:ribulose-phosphate 3-epimerase